MAKVIKAGFARVVTEEQLPSVQNEQEPELDGIPLPFDAEPAEMSEEQIISARQTYQAAYDELIIAAQDEVAAMLSDARNEAIRLMSEAESSVNELRDQAWEEGYSNAVNQAKLQIDDIIARANKDAGAAETRLAEERKRLLEELETQMLGIALDVAGKILHKELSDSDEAYISMLKEAIARMPAEDTVTIRLNPEEYTRFFDKKEVKLLAGKNQVNAKLIPDATLNRFDAVIESPSGVVDAGADTQMAQMKRNMGL